MFPPGMNSFVGKAKAASQHRLEIRFNIGAANQDPHIATAQSAHPKMSGYFANTNVRLHFYKQLSSSFLLKIYREI